MLYNNEIKGNHEMQQHGRYAQNQAKIRWF